MNKTRYSCEHYARVMLGRIKSITATFAVAVICLLSGPACFLIQLEKNPAANVRQGTLRILSFGRGAPLGPPEGGDLYGRDASFVATAFKQAPFAWSRVETNVLSGTDCTPKRLRDELDRLIKNAKASDLVIIHASTHGSTEKGMLYLQGEEETVIDAKELAASLAKLPCPSLVSIDACMAGGAVHSSLPPQSAWLLACRETQSTSGQCEDPQVPHGFQVLALCEGLRGDADRDRDGVVTLGELCAWVPQRATFLAMFSCIQDSVLVLPTELAQLPLTRAVPGEKKPLWTMKREDSRNPWGLPDVPALRKTNKESARIAAILKARGSVVKAWSGCDGIAKPPGDGLAGVWGSRWGATNAEQLSNQGRAEIVETNQAFFVVVTDDTGCYLIEAARDKADPSRLIGRFNSVGSEEPSAVWEGRIIDPRRIDGQTSKGEWNFRR